MSTAPITDATPRSQPSLAAPLAVPVFRRIWLASLLSNFGLLIQGVGAAWAMVQMHAPADIVALVQTALMLPSMLFAMLAGALADMFDRRKVALAALGFAFVSAACLTLFAYAGLLSPPLILMFCFMIGTGSALFSPAWQASVAEQVPAETLPQAVALSSISYNIARSLGPAIGGFVVAAAGAAAAFVVNALFYLPMLIVMFAWRRLAMPARLPPEGTVRAIVSGSRYVFHSPPLRVVMVRMAALGLADGSIFALTPLVASSLLKGGASSYGLLLGAMGVGSLIGALNISRMRRHLSTENNITLGALALGASLVVVAFSRNLPLSLLAMVGTGAFWTSSVTLFNISIQLASPRWVAGRALAAYQTAITGGIAIGSWMWGTVAQGTSVATAMALAGASVAATALLRFLLPMEDAEARDLDQARLREIEVGLNLSGRSGPVAIQLEYRVDPEEARAFYRAMQGVQPIRCRNGGYDWTIARDIADPWQWVERFHCPTWHDYLRQRDRLTREEQTKLDEAFAFHRGEGPPVVRRWLQRPYGSVRWREEARDEGLHEALQVPISLT